jgi:phage shock protein C
MYCTGCGFDLEQKHRFCPQCGKGTAQEAPRTASASSSGKRLVRPMYQKSIAGVCAGFANYLEVDITLMRILWLCVAIFTGVGFIAYIVCWIVMPKDYGPAPAAAPQPQQQPAASAPPAQQPATNP